jgi:hypothetical protein
MMKKYTCLAPAAGLLMAFFTTNASAVIFNFIDLTQKAGGLGESSWSTLSASDHADLNHFGISITGHATDDDPEVAGVPDTDQFAYLDWGNAGLGVCKDAVGAPSGANPGSNTNSCQPSSDDNVTNNEYLEFMFDQDVRVDNIWFNNNHDGGFGAGDKVDIGINMSLSDYAVMTGYAGGANGIGSFLVKQGEKLHVAFNNEQFYISAMEVSAVPVPAAVWLFGTAMAGLLGFQRRRRNT